MFDAVSISEDFMWLQGLCFSLFLALIVSVSMPLNAVDHVFLKETSVFLVLKVFIHTFKEHPHL